MTFLWSYVMQCSKTSSKKGRNRANSYLGKLYVLKIFQISAKISQKLYSVNSQIQTLIIQTQYRQNVTMIECRKPLFGISREYFFDNLGRSRWFKLTLNHSSWVTLKSHKFTWSVAIVRTPFMSGAILGLLKVGISALHVCQPSIGKYTESPLLKQREIRARFSVGILSRHQNHDYWSLWLFKTSRIRIMW